MDTPTTLTGITFQADVYATWAKISVQLPGRCTSDAEARAAAAPYAAMFPKATGMRCIVLNSRDDAGMYYAPFLLLNVKLAADGTNGGRNETGCRRLAQALRTIKKLGGAVEHTGYSAHQVGQLVRGEELQCGDIFGDHQVAGGTR